MVSCLNCHEWTDNHAVCNKCYRAIERNACRGMMSQKESPSFRLVKPTEEERRNFLLDMEQAQRVCHRNPELAHAIELLERWLVDPELAREDGVDPPTAIALETARDYLVTWVFTADPAKGPRYVVPDGDGGVAIKWSMSEERVVCADGSWENNS